MQQYVTMFQRIIAMNISGCTANHIKSNGSRLVFSKTTSRTFCCSLPHCQLDIFFALQKLLLLLYLYSVYLYTTVSLIFSVSKPVCVVSTDWQFHLPMTLIAALNWEKPSHYVPRHHQLRGRAICTHCRGSSCSCLLMDWGPEGLNISVILAKPRCTLLCMFLSVLCDSSNFSICT